MLGSEREQAAEEIKIHKGNLQDLYSPQHYGYQIVGDKMGGSYEKRKTLYSPPNIMEIKLWEIR
jgi:hypothetical protein